MTSFRLPRRVGNRHGIAALSTASFCALALFTAGPASAGDGFVDGRGNTLSSRTNSFVINSFFDGGLLYYKSLTTPNVFNGEISCLNVVGKEATIVADDPSTGMRNRTFVQDNGSSGDKATNHMFNPAALSPGSRAKASACIAPPSATLDALAPLPTGRIRVQEYDSPAATNRRSAKAKKKKANKNKKT